MDPRRPLTSHLKNHSSKSNKTCEALLKKQGRTRKWRSSMDPRRPLTSHLKNHSSKWNKTREALLNEQGRTRKWRSSMDPRRPLTSHLKNHSSKSNKHAKHCWRNKDELVNDVLLWTTYPWTRQCWLTSKNLYQLDAGTGCRLEDMPRAMDDRGGERDKEREREKKRESGKSVPSAQLDDNVI